MLTRAENVTRHSLLAEKVEIAQRFWPRFKGLMGKKSLAADEALLILPCSSIHMFFMRFPIDAVYLDKSGQIVCIDHMLKPWRIGSMCRGVHAVLELAAGVVALSETRVGDQVTIEGVF